MFSEVWRQAHREPPVLGLIIRQFASWVQTASTKERAEGAHALARAYLCADLDPQEHGEAERALTRLLDDRSPLVRAALAHIFADALHAPHHIILALAEDQSDVSTIVLGRSPLLTDAELIDCVAIGDAFAQSAIALRAHVSAPLAAAIAEVGLREALISLAVNPGAILPDYAIRRMIDRYGGDGELREALLTRSDLSASLRSALASATATALAQFVTIRAWMPQERMARVTREALEKANVIIAAIDEGNSDDIGQLVAHLRDSGRLTSVLLLRALLSRNTGLFEAALISLSCLSRKRVSGLMREWQSPAFAALYRKAGLPEALLPVFRAA